MKLYQPTQLNDIELIIPASLDRLVNLCIINAGAVQWGNTALHEI